ncbi:hypothetical protein KK137_00060 [Croceibacterium sp. LX-88]|uniref:Uncharacterized protein n=1 Tax=Croceibacterium selenioxidans TaxID=2838833 RepID=A0ABS5VYV6_9SPHN|nr:hypothetical protein [Croceibacterium selenioxidans]MBT2132711.1 hypothetical protein [Croceibacterium selenioxidans]
MTGTSNGTLAMRRVPGSSQGAPGSRTFSESAASPYCKGQMENQAIDIAVERVKGIEPSS